MDMTALALSFPTLADAARRGFAGIKPFDAVELKRFTRSGASTSGSKQAARFVLSVWNPQNKFDLHDALSVWDSNHRAAFIAWARDPWWV